MIHQCSTTEWKEFLLMTITFLDSSKKWYNDNTSIKRMRKHLIQIKSGDWPVNCQPTTLSLFYYCCFNTKVLLLKICWGGSVIQTWLRFKKKKSRLKVLRIRKVAGDVMKSWLFFVKKYCFLEPIVMSTNKTMRHGCILCHSISSCSWSAWFSVILSLVQSRVILHSLAATLTCKLLFDNYLKWIHHCTCAK